MPGHSGPARLFYFCTGAVWGQTGPGQIDCSCLANVPGAGKNGFSRFIFRFGQTQATLHGDSKRHKTLTSGLAFTPAAFQVSITKQRDTRTSGPNSNEIFFLNIRKIYFLSKLHSEKYMNLSKKILPQAESCQECFDSKSLRLAKLWATENRVLPQNLLGSLMSGIICAAFNTLFSLTGTVLQDCYIPWGFLSLISFKYSLGLKPSFLNNLCL